MAFDPNEPRDGSGRWSRMNSTSRAKLTASARFKGSSQSKGAMRGRSMGEQSRLKPAKVQGDEIMFVGDKKTGRSFPVFKYEESAQAIAIQTAKALDRDFHHAKKQADHEAMKAAIAKSNVPIIKYPSKKPKR